MRLIGRMLLSLGWTLLLLAAARPAMAANKISVADLKQNVASMLSAGKDDEQISNWLKDVELTEQAAPGKQERSGTLAAQVRAAQSSCSISTDDCLP